MSPIIGHYVEEKLQVKIFNFSLDRFFKRGISGRKKAINF